VTAERVSTRAEQAQRNAIRRLRGDGAVVSTADAGAAEAYAGLATRVIALALDAIVIEGSAALVGVTVGLGLSLLHLPSVVDKVIVAVMGALWVLWSVGYFAFFWSTTGQTLGSRAMSIAVVDSGGRGRLKLRRAVMRFIWLCIGAAALLTGILMMLWDDRRRCFHDRLARTYVVYVASEAE
jgi:uncharacterized RDD family membrane protein YckC